MNDTKREAPERKVIGSMPVADGSRVWCGLECGHVAVVLLRPRGTAPALPELGCIAAPRPRGTGVSLSIGLGGSATPGEVTEDGLVVGGGIHVAPSGRLGLHGIGRLDR